MSTALASDFPTYTPAWRAAVDDAASHLGSADWEASFEAVASAEPIIEELSSLINESAADLANDQFLWSDKDLPCDDHFDFSSPLPFDAAVPNPLHAENKDVMIACSGPCSKMMSLHECGLSIAPTAWDFVCTACSPPSSYVVPPLRTMFEAEE